MDILGIIAQGTTPAGGGKAVGDQHPKVGSQGLSAPVHAAFKVKHPLGQHIPAHSDDKNQNRGQCSNQGNRHHGVELPQESCTIHGQQGEHDHRDDTADADGDVEQRFHQVGKQGNGSRHSNNTHQGSVYVKEDTDDHLDHRVGTRFVSTPQSQIVGIVVVNLIGSDKIQRHSAEESHKGNKDRQADPHPAAAEGNHISSCIHAGRHIGTAVGTKHQCTQTKPDLKALPKAPFLFFFHGKNSFHFPACSLTRPETSFSGAKGGKTLPQTSYLAVSWIIRFRIVTSVSRIPSRPTQPIFRIVCS